MDKGKLMRGLILMMGLILSQNAWVYGGREPPVTVDEHIVQNLTGPTTFAIVPMRYQVDDGYLDRITPVIREELTKRGYKEADAKTAELIVIVVYNLADVTEYLYVPPVYTRVLRLTMLDRAAYAQKKVVKRFEASTVSRGEDSNLRMILPLHVRAIFYNFPGPPSVSQTVTVPGPTDQGLKLEKPAVIDPSFQYLNTDYPFEN